MINRTQVENILKINGVSPTSPDEEIRSVLFSARYDKDEVDTAIMVLREDAKTAKTRVDGLHKVFRTEDTLTPLEITQLLGIEVDVEQAVEVRKLSRRELTTWQYVAVFVLSIIFASIGILLYMYLHSIGVFHPSSNITLR